MSDAASKISIPHEKSAARTGGGSLFLLTPSGEPCGVEVFTGKLVAALAASDPDAGCAVLGVSGRWRDVPQTMSRLLRAERAVFSLPLVAWKRMLVIPLLLLLCSVVGRRRIVVFMHEWSALHWLRRLAIMPFIVLSDAVVVLSPYIRDQIARDRWVGRAAKKCSLVPHPPTIRRPAGRKVTAVVQRVERAARDSDIVIGYFGAIYRGKAPAALLEICQHLRGRGIRASVVFAGSFTKSLDGYEGEFRARLNEMALEKSVIVTGYISTEEELFALFERIGVFLFLFPEGLTARRSSVIACLQSGRPVVVSAPQRLSEFAHHRGLSELIESGALSFVPGSAGIADIADQLLAAAGRKDGSTTLIDTDAWWKATTSAARAAL